MREARPGRGVAVAVLPLVAITATINIWLLVERGQQLSG
jgi:hypothetical protein